MKKTNIIVLTLVIFLIPGIVNAKSLDCSEPLLRGDVNNEVKVLQRKLNKIMDCNLEIDGSFGPLTQKCVMKFQKKYNLSKDGMVGPQTCKKINTKIKELTNSSKSTTETDNTKTNNNQTPPSTNRSTTTSTTTNNKITNISSGNKVVVTGGTVNIRTDASINTKVQAKVTRGTILKIYGSKTSKNMTWYKVLVNGKYGYISSMYAKRNCILVNIKNQKLTYYKNGTIYMDTKVVTGMKGINDTPSGTYTLKVSNKETARTLRGKNNDGTSYASYVDYWMPFNGGIGFHDASWRTSADYNSSTYTYNGSHGCINMQKKDAKKLYNATTTDTTVVVA